MTHVSPGGVSFGRALTRVYRNFLVDAAYVHERWRGATHLAMKPRARRLAARAADSYTVHMTRAGSARVVVVGVACFAAVGCGGSSPPKAASPDDETTSMEAPAAPAESEGKSKAPEESPKAPESSSAESPTSADELGSILQRVIEDDELDKYLKLTLPGRFPLKISGADLPSGLSLTKGNQPVQVVSTPSSKKDAILVITTVEITGKDATIAYRYDVEGIRGTARLKKGERGWELKNSRIVEH
ncbi:MAG TPA: hypothetical protein VF395_19685 [Polyangiaceae bacterium]